MQHCRDVANGLKVPQYRPSPEGNPRIEKDAIVQVNPEQMGKTLITSVSVPVVGRRRRRRRRRIIGRKLQRDPSGRA